VKRNRLSDLSLKEFSLVRRPAQEGALIGIVKSTDDIPIVVAKGYYETPTTACPGCSTKTDSKYCPDCGMMLKSGTQPTEKTMTDQEKAAMAALEAQVASLQKAVTKAQKISLLNDVQKGHFHRIGADAQVAFLDMTDAQRAEEAKPVFTSKSGQVFTKADDTRLVETVKAQDVITEKLEKQLADAGVSIFKARCETELSHLPGKVEAKIILLKAVEAVEDKDLKAEALGILKAQDEKLGKGFRTIGLGHTTTVDVDKSAEGKLESLVKGYMKDHPELTEAQAWDAVLVTPAGETLYKAMS
jgi:hypothetical protein